MRPFFALLALTILVSAASSSQTQAQFMPAPIDVGNLSSDGNEPWQYVVRPVAPGEVVPGEIIYPGPPLDMTNPPATPVQSTIRLYEGEPLVFVVPNTGYSLMDVEVTHEIEGYEINAIVSRTYGRISDDSEGNFSLIEYLHPLGALDAGNYSLNLLFVTAWDNDPPTLITGYIPFSVAAIPTPGTLGVLLPAVALAAIAMRWKLRRV